METYYSLQGQGIFSLKMSVEEYVGLCYEMVEKLAEAGCKKLDGWKQWFLYMYNTTKNLWNKGCVHV